MRILVTGGAGFIGSAFMSKLLTEGHTPTSFDLKPSPVGDEGIIGDILDQDAVDNAVKRTDRVFHFAAAADLNYCAAHSQKAIDLNVRGTHTFAKACAKYAVPLHFASTCCVYGDTPDHPSDESSIPVPTEIYAVTKIAAEEILKEYAAKKYLPYTILRLGTTYGSGMRGALAIYWWITEAAKGVPLTIHGTGEQTRSMIYIDDLVEALYKVATSRITNMTLNLTRPEEKSVLETAGLVNKLMDRTPDNIWFTDDRPGQIMKESININKASTLLNWFPHTSLEEGIRKTIPWVLEQN
uniref:Putative NADH dehydrogenase n=1 Tax=viral metagenome TaxID=1070528 RepID=A0A6M3LXH3_9ZZZZ